MGVENLELFFWFRMPLMAEEKETIALISVNPSKSRKSKILYHFEKLHMLLSVRVIFFHWL